MSTSPSPAAGTLAAPAVFSPIPRQVPTSSSASSSASGGSPAAQAAGYAAGWAQGVAAAAAAERTALAGVAADAAAERERSRAAVAGALASLEAAATRMRLHVVPAVDAVADVLATAAIDLAEVVVGHEVADGAGGAGRGRAALDRALAAAPEHEDLVVRLHPADLAVLADLGPGAPAAPPAGPRAVRLVADPSVAPGDAVADFAGGSVDARVATALGRMRASLRSGVRTAPHDGARA